MSKPGFELTTYHAPDLTPEQAKARTAVGVTARDLATGLSASCHVYRTREANKRAALAELVQMLAARAGGEGK